MLDAFLKLPYEFLIPNTLFEEELLKFTAAQKKTLLRGGLKVIDLPGAQVLRAQAVMRQVPELSMHDGFAFALAESHPECILLTGEKALRKLARQHKMEVHGVLWVLDEIHGNRLGPADDILKVLKAFHDDATVRLPRRELTAYVKRYESLK